MKKVFTLFLLLLCTTMGWAGVDPTPTTDLVDGTYVLKAYSDKSANGSYVFITDDGNNAYADANTDTKNFEGQVTALTESLKKYLWTIHKNDNGTITITSAQNTAKSFPVASGNTQKFTLSSTAGSYTLTPVGDSNPDCFYMLSSSYYVYANGSAGSANSIGFWQNVGTPAVKMKFYKATIDETLVNVTYNYTHNGQTLKTVSTQWGVGNPYPKTSLPDYVTATLPEGTVPNEAVTKDVPVAWDDMPLKENQWCFVKLGIVTTASQNGYLYDKGDNATRIDMGVIEKDLSTNHYLWKFEGDPFNGYTIKSASGKKLVTPTVTNNGGTTYPYAAAAAPTNGFDTWVVYKPTATNVLNNNGFFLAVKDHPTWKLNSRTVSGSQNALSFWTEGAGDGSGVFVDAALPEITFNTLNGKNYATYYLPFAAKAPEGVKAYAGAISDGCVKLTEYVNGVIPANKGVLLVSDTQASASFTLADESEVTEQTNELTGVLTTTELSSVANSTQVRIFSKKNEVAGFYVPNSSITTLAANKAYIVAPTGTNALALSFDGESTGINTILDDAAQANDSNAPIYDLGGRRVMHALTPGIYVKNGKKLIVK